MSRFCINDIVYDSQLLEVENDTGIEQLDPRLASLLDVFIHHPDKVLSRDFLLQEVWQGAVVSDNTLNWTVSQLRKILGDDSASPRFILTVPKKGYRFIGKVSVAKSSIKANAHGRLEKSVPQQPELEKKFKTNVMWPAIGLLLGFALLINWVFKESSAGYQLSPDTLLTSLEGIERGGRVSSDGVMLVFRHKSQSTANRYHIYLKPLIDTTNFAETLPDGSLSNRRLDGQRLQPSYPLAGLPEKTEYFDVIWGKDSYQLYAVEKDELGCRIVEINLPVSRLEVLQRRVITSCHEKSHTKLALNDNRLLFTNADADQSYQVMSFDLNTAEQQELTRPVEAGLGDHFIDLHSGTQKLLILRNIDWKQTRFVELDLRTLEQQTLIELASIYYTAYWGPDGKDIWLNWGNDRVLRYVIADKSSHTLLQSGFGWNFDAHPVSREGAIFTVSDANAADLLQYEGGEFKKIVTAFTERLPAFSPETGRLAYVSNQSGLPQIWLKDEVTAARQLTSLETYKEFHYLFWSRDEKWIVGNSQTLIGAMDLTEERFRILYDGPLTPHFPSLSKDKHTLVFAAKQQDSWQLYQVDLTKPQSKALPLTEGMRHSWLTDNKLLISRYQSPGLILFSLDDLREEVLLPELPADSRWLIFNDAIYFRQADEGRQIFQTPLENFDPQPVVALPEEIGRFALHPDGKTWLFEDWRQSQTDLKFAEIQN